MVIHKKSLAITLVIIMLIADIVFNNQILFLGYIDEIIGIIGVLYFVIQGVLCKINNVNKKIITLIILICLLGLLGNVIYGISGNVFAIFSDVLKVIKVLFTFMFVSTYLNSIDAKRVAHTFENVSKLFLILSTIVGIVSLFIDLGMGSEVRFGIKSFKFIFPYVHVFAIMCLCALLMIAINEHNDKRKIYRYTVLTILCEILTTKGPSLIWCVMILFLYVYYVHNRKIKFWVIVALGIVSILMGGYQITNYFLNETAPRALLLRYGIVTANRFFPLGSGFATYGSEMANRYYYSPLYYEYGFNSVWGLTASQGHFLNDNYWPMLMAQTGYIGAILMLIIYFTIFRQAQEICENRIIKSTFVSSYIYIILHSLGSASITSAEGTLLFFTFGVVLAACHKKIISESE